MSIDSVVQNGLSVSYIFDLPSDGWGKGGPKFLRHLAEVFAADNPHAEPRVGFGVCSQSRYSRLLQAADFVTSCTLAYLMGERQYAPQYVGRLFALVPATSARWPNGGFWAGEDEATAAALRTSMEDALP